MVTLIKGDLEHILKQIKLAEEHTRLINQGMDPAEALSQLISSPLMPTGLRTVDGAFNNFMPGYTYSGASDVPMTRLLDMSWAPAEANPRTGAPTSYESYSGSVYDSQPRIISNLVADQTLSNPAAIAAALASVGITGAESLAIVRDIMALQVAAQTAQAAVTGAAAAAEAALEAAQLVVDGAEVDLQAAIAAADTAATAQAQATQAFIDAQAALDTANANLAAHAPLVGAAQVAADSALAALQAAQNTAQQTQAAYVLAFATLASAQQVEAQALSAFQADNSPQNAAAYFAAVDAREAAAADYAVKFEQDEDADEAVVLAQASHSAAVASLQSALQTQSALESAVDTAAAGLAQAQAALADADVGLSVASAALDAAQTALDDAVAARDGISTGEAATSEAQAVADAAAQAVIDELTTHGVSMDGDNVFIKNIAADLGDTASFNGFMTIFGQFFDHGLDLTAKGGSGTVYVPLMPDDPLYVQGSPTNFMVLTRATNDPGPDGILGNIDDIREHRNETTPWTDLNQVYTSNASHQVFLREYIMVDGKPIATGHMLEGAAGGPPTWADIKNQAREKLGIELSDLNVHAVPAVLTDLYGEFVRGANGLPQLVTPDGAVEGILGSAIDAMQALPAGRAFLNDIAHTAAPGQYVIDRNMQTGAVTYGVQTADADTETGNAQAAANAFGGVSTYDNELLDRHFIVGDGRGNENIALTAVHTIFHGEHNRQVEEIKHGLLEGGDIAFLNEWLLVDVTEVPADVSTLVWDGERLFQAARFSTEMVYQHLIFEEFVRAIAPQIDPFVFSNSVEIDGAIFEEFAQVVYRFGHSMLNENVDILSLTGGAPDAHAEKLMDAFLNPVMFDQQGVTAQQAAGAVLRGMTRQAGNEIDEFVTDALRNNLVGLPLDLATINLTRARETGVPSLNEARRQIFDQTHDSYLKPYSSWTDFAQNIKNPLSIVNFIAAYGTHATILAADTVEEKREAAWNLVFGAEGETTAQRDERLAFLNATGTWADDPTLGGLNAVDFWIGGLAEALMPFGGMLGSTFTFVFELQIEKLQNGDRMYYLSRTQGMNLLTELEGDSFADVIRRNTDTGDTGLHINGAAFQTADYIIEMNQARQYNPGLGSDDPSRPGDVLSALTGQDSLVVRIDSDNDGDIDHIRYLGGEHVVIGGTNEDDTIIAGAGDDTVWGEGGNDRIEGGFGVDHIHGGAGDDIITDSGTDIGDADVLKGEAGDDVINGGMGLDLVFGGAGKDVLSGGSEAKSLFGGTGDDFIRAASGGGGTIFGNEGDDWMEGQGNMTTLTGDNSELFFNSRIIGHDIMLSGENDTDFDAESGDDVMVQGIGINRNNGMAGFDWVTFKDNAYGADADMNVSIFVNQQNNILRDRYDLVEGLSGWNQNDKLTGREFVIGAYDANGNATQVDADAPIESFSNVLLEKNLDLIKGLRELVDHLERFDVWNPNNLLGVQGEDGGAVTFEVIDPSKEKLVGVMDTSDGSDILLGGGGSDTLRGMAGNDIIDGDKWLDVYIAIRDSAGSVFATARSLTSQVLDAVSGATLFGGKTLEALMFSRDIKPSQLEAMREIRDGGQEGDVDTAVYWDVFENYQITRNADGSVTVAHITTGEAPLDTLSGRALGNEGVDRLFNVELLQFRDQTVDLRNSAPAVALDGFDTVTKVFADNFNAASNANDNGPSVFSTAWAEAGDGADSVTAGNVQIDQNNSNELRFNPGASDGATLTRSLDLTGMTSAAVTFTVSDQNISQNSDVFLGFIQLGNDDERLHFEYAADGANFVTLATFTGDNGGNQSVNLPRGSGFGSNVAIRFRLEGTPDRDGLFELNTERFSVDNLVISANGTTALTPPNINLASTFEEGKAAISVASEPVISDNGAVLASARVVLTNAAAGDALAVGTLPAGVTGSVTSTADTITVTLTGEASLEAYQAAVQAVTFRNTSDNPSTTPRVIQVTVSDGDLDSAPATHTVTITPVEDPTSASADSIVTNIARGAAITVPEWALLNNDVDLDSAISVTATDNVNGLSGFMRADGQVSFTDPVTGFGGGAGGSFRYTATGSNSDSATATLAYDTNGTLSGNGSSNILIGNNLGNVINGGGGNDVILGNDGDDVIEQTSTQGRDVVDGGAGTDTYRLSGVNGAELFRIYAVTNGQNAGLGTALATTFRGSTEIVITRTVNGVETVIAELDDIEEIEVNTLAVSADNGNGAPDGGTNSGDTIEVIGNFDTTSLNYSTITIDGTDGNDTIDISALTSAHRIVFRSNGGSDTIIGTLRPQDVVELPSGSDPAAFVRTFDGTTGLSTLSDGTHHVSYAGDFDLTTEVVLHPEDDDLCDDDDHDDDDGQHGNDGAAAPVGAGAGSMSQPIAGTASGDVLIGTSGNDLIFGLAGVDYVIAGAGADVARLDAGDDFADAGAGRDIVWGGEGDDDVLGGEDEDMLYGEAGDDWLSGDAGHDLIDGGDGNDDLFGGEGNDHFIGRINDGNDLIDGGAGADTLDFGSLSQAVHVNLGTGIGGRGHVTGAQSGTDTLYGIENVTTGSGNDTIVASNAVNVMDGGAGEDVFVFGSAAAANGDTIVNFEAGDKLDVSGMLGGADSFTLVTGAPAAGEIAVTHEAREDGDYTVVTGNTDGGDPDFKISITGTHTLTSSDFNL